MKMSRLYFVFLILIVFTASCSGKQAVKPPEKFDAEKSFEKGNAQFEKKNYEEARAIFLEVKNRDLSRKFAPLAQLKIADSYAQEDEPERAVAEYQRFLETYPDHQYASYAQYQIAMVYFNQIESPERGYSGAAKALVEFEKLEKMFPRNPYREIIDLKIEKCRNTMAEYEYLVGSFYYKKGSYMAAIGRFDGLMKKYPEYQGEAEVLFYTGMSYKNLGQKEKASEYFTRLIEKHPNNKLVKDAKKQLSSLNRK
jgi:outer membrane protein assembly factor BamD